MSHGVHAFLLTISAFAAGAGCGGATSGSVARDDGGTPAAPGPGGEVPSPHDGDPGQLPGNGDAGPPVDAGSCPGCKRVFVTSTTVNGAFGGLAAGDAICNDAGKALGGTFKAWLSDGTKAGTPPARFTQSSRPYVRTDGVIVVSSFGDLLQGKDILQPIDRDETGALVQGSKIPVWSNVNDNADVVTTAPDLFCQGWTSTAPTDEGAIGYADAVAGLPWGAVEDWTVSGATAIPCATQAHLYCFEQ